MALSPGVKLGPYEILAAIGAGGMGKVLPLHLSENLELKQRFEREACMISSLSHPHICALYDVGSHEGTDCLVMEYLEAIRLHQKSVSLRSSGGDCVKSRSAGLWPAC